MGNEKDNDIKLAPSDVIQFGLLLPLMTIFAIASVFIFLTLAFIIIFFLQPIIKEWTIATNKKINWVNVIGSMFVPFVGLLSVTIFVKALYYFETLFLVFSFLIGLCLFLYKRNIKITNVIQENFILKLIADYSSNLLGLLIIVASSVCILMFSLGYVNARYIASTSIRKYNNTILLRNYSTYKIFRIRDRKETFIISKSINDNDTLDVFKTK